MNCTYLGNSYVNELTFANIAVTLLLVLNLAVVLYVLQIIIEMIE